MSGRRTGRLVSELGRVARRVLTQALERRQARGTGARTPGIVAPRADVATTRARPEIAYAPVADGDADPGEVVWTWVPYEDDASRGKDRPVLVIGRLGGDVAALQLTSRAHDDQHHHPLGGGGWDHERRPSWVKLDRVLRLDPDGIRREGAILDRRRFDGVIAAFESYDAGNGNAGRR